MHRSGDECVKSRNRSICTEFESLILTTRLTNQHRRNVSDDVYGRFYNISQDKFNMPC